MKNFSRVCVLVGSFAITSAASAADPVAESMFQQGLALMKEGKFEDGCRVLEASQKLEPKSGTLAVLGSCHEQIGRTATAWAEYKEAAALARSEGRQNHADKATELAKALESKLSMLRVDAQLLQGGVTVVVRLNGANIVDGSLGVAFAVDPGEHTITASAPGRREWTTKVIVGPSGDRQTIAVPELEIAVPDAETPVIVPDPPPLIPPRDVPPPPQEQPLVVWPWVVGGLGIAALGGAAAALGVSRSAGGDLDEVCGEARTNCPLSHDIDADYDRETAAFGAFVGLGVVGGIAATAGVIGLVIGSQPESVTDAEARVQPDLLIGPDGLRIGLRLPL